MSNDIDTSVEGLGRRRRQILFGFLMAWTTWWAVRLVEDLTRNGQLLPSLSMWVLLLVQAASYINFIFVLFRFHFLNRHLRQNPTLSATLNDELVQQVWLKALKVGFLCTLGCQSLIAGLAMSHLLPSLFSAAVGADITMVVALPSCLAAFLWLERG